MLELQTTCSHHRLHLNHIPNGRASIDLDEEDGVDASRSVKKRYWSHEEEVKLVITLHKSY